MDGIGVWGATPGKGSGIGKKIIERLIQEGYDNIHVFGRKKEQLEILAKNNKKINGWFVYDIANEDRTREFEKYIFENNISTMISTVGFGKGGTLPELPKEDLFKMSESNFVVPSLILKSTLAPFHLKGGGRVIMFSSIVAINPREGASGYTGSKTALKGLIESARYELRNVFPKVSIHSIYSTSFRYAGYRAVLDAISYLLIVKQGVHVDIVLSLK